MDFIYSSSKREFHSPQFEKLSPKGAKVAIVIESFRLEATSGGLSQYPVHSRSQSILLKDLSACVLDAPRMGIP